MSYGVVCILQDKQESDEDEEMTKTGENRCRIMLALIVILTSGLYLAAYHDMQTADGVGLYLAMKAGAENRLPYDILCDVLRGAGLLAMLMASCLLTRNMNLKSFSRLFFAWLAWMPVFSMAELLHFPDETILHLSLAESGLWESVQIGDSELLALFRVWIPVVCLLLAANQLSGIKVREKWYLPVAAVQMISAGAILIMPGWASLFREVICYLLLLLCFDLWEKWLREKVQLQKWSCALFSIMWLRGVWRLIELMSVKSI